MEAWLDLEGWQRLLIGAIASCAIYYVISKITYPARDAITQFLNRVGPQNRVELTADGVRRKARNALRWQAVPWSCITEVGAEAVDQLTYRENFVILVENRDEDRWFPIGEFDVGFKEVIAAINGKFPGIAVDWYGHLEQSAPGTYLTIWRKADAVESESILS